MSRIDIELARIKEGKKDTLKAKHIVHMLTLSLEQIQRDPWTPPESNRTELEEILLWDPYKSPHSTIEHKESDYDTIIAEGKEWSKRNDAVISQELAEGKLNHLTEHIGLADTYGQCRRQ